MNLLNVPRQPFVGLALAAAVGIMTADILPHPSLALPLLLVVGALLVSVWPTSIITYMLVGLGFFWMHSLNLTSSPGLQLLARLGPTPGAITTTGSVISEPKIGPNGLTSFLLRLESIDRAEQHESVNGKLLVRWRGHPEFGDELKLFGVVDAIAPARNPGEFDMRSYLKRRDIHQSLLVRYAEDGLLVRHGGGSPILRTAQKSRRWMQSTLCRGLEGSADVQSFISGIALGLRHQAPEDIEEPFQQTGTLHLFAVAGLHVGIVARLLWMLATVAQLPRRWAAALIIPLILFYSAITGLHVSSVRAAIMSSVLLGGLFFERRVFAFNSLAAAAFFLLCSDTNELFSTGFQLSFSVVGGILLLAEPLFLTMQRMGAPDHFLPRSLLSRPRRFLDGIHRWICRGSSVSLAAWVGSLPLIWWYYYLVTPISLVANLVVVPLAFFVLAIGLLSILSASFSSSLSLIFNNANWLLAKVVLGMVHMFAQMPGGHYYIAHPQFEEPSKAKLTVLDLGVGAAVDLRSYRSNWLLDCGSERNYERILRPYLHSTGVNRLAGLLLSHGDALHIGGTRRLLDDLPLVRLVDNPVIDRSAVHRRLRREIEERGHKSNSLALGESIAISKDVSARILFLDSDSAGTTADDQVMVVQLAIAPSTKVLMMSDSGYKIEKALVSSGADLRSEILIKGQHRSGESGSALFLQAVHPRLIIATSRDFPAHERISDEWAAAVRTAGIKLFRQDETGAVELRFASEYWEARAYVTGETFRSSSR